MKFIPFTDKYLFKKDTLLRGFPDYMSLPISNWMGKLLRNANAIGINHMYGTAYIESEFLDEININFREVFPKAWTEALPFIFSDSKRAADFIAMCLQNFADASEAAELETILATGGSAFKVVSTKKDASEYEEGVYTLSERVSPIVAEQSIQALDNNDLLQEAWQLCYSRNPDYGKSVIKCQNFLEHFLRDKYEPTNTEPQIGKLIGNLKKTSQKLKFKGDTVLSNKETILSLIDNIAQFRGIHTAGTGKIPNKEEAEYVLHTTIYIWNLHQR